MRTFSGAHPFDPQHLIDAYLESTDDDTDRSDAVSDVADLLAKVGEGRCLRCGTPFRVREIPSGSRVTDCRCIPICSLCSEAEAYWNEAMVLIKGPEDAALLALVDGVCEWPVDPGKTAEGVAEFRERHKMTPAAVSLGELELDDPRSGWLAFGHDDTRDREERER